MRISTNLLVIGAAGALVACGGGGDSGAVVEPLLGPDATPIEASSAYSLLEVRVEDIFFAEGITLEADLPDGSPTYRGIIAGGDETDGGVGTVSHYADLALTTNLDSNTVSGSITNYVTDVTDFENPDGTVTLSGTVSNDGADATLTFQGSGNLSTGTTAALVTVLDADGVFVGDDGAGIQGTHITDFDWTLGYIGSEASDGRLLAERN